MKDLVYQPVKLRTESLSDEDKLDIERSMQLDKMNKPLWFEINKSDFAKLTREIDNNQNNKDFKIIINKKPYDLKNAKNSWIEVTTRKISKSDAKKLYNELIQKNINALTKEKSNNAKKYNILNILNNVGAIFTGTYLHYRDVPKEILYEKSIAERRKQKKRTSKIKIKEKNISNGLFREYVINYRNPSNIYEELHETKGAVNENQVDLIKKVLAKMKKKPLKMYLNIKHLRLNRMKR